MNNLHMIIWVQLIILLVVPLFGLVVWKNSDKCVIYLCDYAELFSKHLSVLILLKLYFASLSYMSIILILLLKTLLYCIYKSFECFLECCKENNNKIQSGLIQSGGNHSTY